MANVKVVTGFIPVPGHPRGVKVYEKLGLELIEACFSHDIKVRSFHDELVADTWLWRALEASHLTEKVTYGTADNPAKNSLAYHCVQHQKFEWLERAAREDKDDTDMFVWVDYGIMHVPGITAKVITDGVRRVPNFSVCFLPGCLKFLPDTNHYRNMPCWRFCGGVMAVPKSELERFCKTMKYAALAYIQDTNHIEWEVNTMARAEQLRVLPIIWFQADHDQTMFTKLGGAL